ncbi:PolC-type DNA polymerase III [uncultured Methanobrevibacter sp.]|uniref:3'-5' exonuclease n=1 Tax=uncultured Methanobrevibacter sp. TaxID=253161 RepID=UPI0025D9D211|nr:3'-5' exonuclease [uncultured Methanobrevibacter sp.]
MFKIKVIYFDTETTGLNCFSCRVIELAMLVYEDGEIIEEYDHFIDIGEKLDSKITRLTGITDDMLDEEGIYEDVIADDLKKWLTPGTLMVAHNCQFDLSFIYNLLRRHFPGEADGIVKNVDWLDTLTVVKDRKEYPHKLIDAVEYYGIEKVNFHRAIDDTKALYNVTQALKNERNDLEEYLNIFGYNPKYGVNGVKFEFIDYKPQYYTKFMVPENKILPKK